MEMQVTGPNGTIEMTRDAYEALKDRFLSEQWDSSGDFSGADWCFEGRLHFENWLYELAEAGAL